MTKIIFIEANGTHHEVEAAEGMSVMEAAVRNGIDGIDADCGGACACATCHVHIAADWLTAVGKATDNELDMLECAIDPDETSRLSCQIRIVAALDGLTVTLPSSQH